MIAAETRIAIEPTTNEPMDVVTGFVSVAVVRPVVWPVRRNASQNIRPPAKPKNPIHPIPWAYSINPASVGIPLMTVGFPPLDALLRSVMENNATRPEGMAPTKKPPMPQATAPTRILERKRR